MADCNGKVKDTSKTTELNLDNCRKDNNSILSIVEEHPALETLSLINVGLSSLKGFPKLANLKKLRLADNRISDGLDYLVSSPKLQNLDLSGNKIKDLEALEALQKFLQLNTLDLFNNEVTQVENYREKLFKMLPSLKFLDGVDSKNVAAPSDDEDDDDLNGNESDDDDSEDLDEYDDDEDEDEEDVSLAEIYNEDLDEDNSDWEESEGGDDDDDEIESDDEDGEANKSSTKSPASAAKGGEKKAVESTDSQPPGKKRKTAEEKN